MTILTRYISPQSCSPLYKNACWTWNICTKWPDISVLTIFAMQTDKFGNSQWVDVFTVCLARSVLVIACKIFRLRPLRDSVDGGKLGPKVRYCRFAQRQHKRQCSTARCISQATARDLTFSAFVYLCEASLKVERGRSWSQQCIHYSLDGAKVARK